MKMFLFILLSAGAPGRGIAPETAIRQNFLSFSFVYSDTSGISVDLNFTNTTADTVIIRVPSNHHLAKIFPNMEMDTVLLFSNELSLLPGQRFSGKLIPFHNFNMDSSGRVLLDRGKFSQLNGSIASSGLWIVYDSASPPPATVTAGGSGISSATLINPATSSVSFPATYPISFCPRITSSGGSGSSANSQAEYAEHFRYTITAQGYASLLLLDADRNVAAIFFEEKFHHMGIYDFPVRIPANSLSRGNYSLVVYFHRKIVKEKPVVL